MARINSISVNVEECSEVLVPHGYHVAHTELVRDTDQVSGLFYFSPTLLSWDFIPRELVDRYAEQMEGLGWDIRFANGVPLVTVQATPTSITFNCYECQGVVVASGHPGWRRLMPTMEHVDRMRRLAWLGELAHIRDIRLLLLARGLDSALLDVRAREYLSRDRKATFYSHSPDVVYSATDPNVESMAVAFDANYFGSFRDRYLDETFGVVGGLRLPDYLRCFYRQSLFPSHP